MATLYVENVPEDLYEALRAQARRNRKSISAEVLDILEHMVPTPAVLERRREAIKRALEIQAMRGPSEGPFPTAEEMLREDRDR
jgi:plasmid stability protein